jgi:CheY-like chemotaxis protein
MNKKVLILDNDDATIRLIQHLSRALNLDTLAIHNWGKSVNLIQGKDVLVVFLNVELGIVNIPSFLIYFPQEKKDDHDTIVPVYFLFTKLFSRQFQAAKTYPHAGELKKPVKLESLVEIFNGLLNIDEVLDYNEQKYRDKWGGINAYLNKAKEFMRQLETILG